MLEDANGKLLYVDEINLLDDHVVNIILDVTATGILNIQREGRQEKKPIFFTLIGTMNPEEGRLRTQLLDRFGLMVVVESEEDSKTRAEILQTVLAFDRELALKAQGKPTPKITAASKNDERKKKVLKEAKDRFYAVEMPDDILAQCVKLSEQFKTEGHRAVKGAGVGCAAPRSDGMAVKEQVAFFQAVNTRLQKFEVTANGSRHKLRELAIVLVERVRKNASIDWSLKESVRAKMRVTVKRLLRKYGYLPDIQALATETVLQQAELLAGFEVGEAE